MKLTFLGTRANIDSRSRRHRKHSALEIAYKDARIVVDCGLDWLGRVKGWRAAAIFLTHAHPDHAFGLQHGAPCPVYATKAAWEGIAKYPIRRRQTVVPGRPVRLRGLVIEAFPVTHSLRAPAVGYRVGAGRRTIFYAPDLVDIAARVRALRGIDLYIGDGSTLTRSLVRRRGDLLFGHTTIHAQLGWCAEEGVPRALFTHCGEQIVAGDERALRARIAAMAAEQGVEADLAHDGQEIVLR